MGIKNIMRKLLFCGLLCLTAYTTTGVKDRLYTLQNEQQLPIGQLKQIGGSRNGSKTSVYSNHSTDSKGEIHKSYTLHIQSTGHHTTPHHIFVTEGVNIDDVLSIGTSLSGFAKVREPVELVINAPNGGKLSATQLEDLHEAFPNIISLQDNGTIGRSVRYNFSVFQKLTILSERVPAWKTGEVILPDTMQKMILTAVGPRWYRGASTLSCNTITAPDLSHLLLSCAVHGQTDMMEIPPRNSLRINHIVGLNSLTGNLFKGDKNFCALDLRGTRVPAEEVHAQRKGVNILHDIVSSHEIISSDDEGEDDE